jgi:dTDP-4-dehydrorhamnose 3,5-epimerase
MKTEATNIPGHFILKQDVHEDLRGRFMKIVHAPTFRKLNLAVDFVEQYYSESSKGVLRGMHLQMPPFDHEKLVTCLLGEIVDVVVDLRRRSPTYGHHSKIAMSAKSGTQAYIPRGLAHGFYVTSESALVHYNVTSVHAPEHDAGILWSSAGIAWPDQKPNLSDRDRKLPRFEDFESPF